MAVETSAPRVHARTQGNRVALAVWAGLATAAILLLIDGLVAGRSLIRNLTIARSELNVGIEAVVTGDPGAAAPHFEGAAAAADRAAAAAGHPALGIAGLLPVAGANIDAAAQVAEASRDTALAGTAMVRVARTLDWTDIGLPAAAAAGSLDIGALEEAAPQMDAVVARLAGALTELEAIGGDGLVGPVATGYRDALENLARRADLAARLRDAIRLGAAMFGGERTHRYLLCVPSLGRPRAGGGAPATVGLLVAEQGSLLVEPIGGGLGGLTPAPDELLAVTPSPDWPTTATALLDAARAAGAPRLDGAISLDSIALQDLVWVAGDVSVQRRGLALSDSTTAAALELDAFLVPVQAKAARTHASWTSEIVRSFLARRPGIESFALATAHDAHARHLRIFATRRATQGLVSALGLDGAMPAPEKGVIPVMASWSSTDESHVGALVATRIGQDVRLRADGSAVILTEVSFENGAGTDPPSQLLGLGKQGVPVGTFAADVTVHLPAGARSIEAETSRPSPISVGEDLGYATVIGSVSIRGGSSATLTVGYVVRNAVVERDDGKALALRLLPQPTLEGIGYSVRITLPEGAGFVSTRGLVVRGSTASFTGVRTGPADVEVVYVE